MARVYAIKNFKINKENLALQETLFHNANGYIGVRGTLEESSAENMDTMRGMYLNGVYDIAPMKQAEKLCNLVEEKETMVNVADTQTIDLYFEGEHFSIWNDKISNFERKLDMEDGVSERKLDWQTRKGSRIRIEIIRMTSFEERALFTIDYRITSVDFCGKLEIKSLHKGLVQNYFNPDDPRLAGESHQHLQKKDVRIEGRESCLVSQTAKSKIQIASSVTHCIYKNEVQMEEKPPVYHKDEHSACLSDCIQLEPGDRIRIVKYTVFADSIRCRDCMVTARTKMEQILKKGIDFYYECQRKYLKDFWENAAMKIEGDEDMDSSVSFNMYALLQAAGADGHASIAAKGLSGEGYEGHYFWDTEMFMLPFFALTNPDIAKQLLTFRYETLNKAKENAALLGHEEGALYPWRTITGRECSGYFPSGTAQYHINGDIAYAIVLYYLCTGNWEFIKEKGLEVLLETGRLWMDVGCWKEDRFCINCVTGPDEYTCMVNNNYYTNACARYNLEWIGRFTDKFQKEDGWRSFADQMGLTIRELEEMDGAAKGMFLPYDEKLGINPQDDSFLSKPVWDIKGTPKDKFPLLLHYHPLHLYRYQVCKQADTILSYFLFPDYQDEETMKKSFSYYEEITTHDSSLSTCVFSIMASRLGMKEKAYRYLGDSAKLDLLNTHKNTKDGIHAANMGGCYMAIVFGFAMLQIKENTIALSPWLPDAWHAYRFRFRYQGRLVEVQVNRDESRIHLLKGETVETEFYGAKKRLEEKQGLKWDGREVCFL